MSAPDQAEGLAAKAPEERRRRILAAAVEVVRERGFAATRVTDIAEAAGTSAALVLYHFGSLDDALLAALSFGDEAYYNEVDAGTDGLSDPLDRLAGMGALAAADGPAIGDWDLWVEVWVRARHDARVDQVRRELDERWRARLLTVIEDGVAAGVFRAESPADAATRLAALLDGLAVQVVLGDPSVPSARLGPMWLAGAARELGVEPGTLLGRAARFRDRASSSPVD